MFSKPRNMVFCLLTLPLGFCLSSPLSESQQELAFAQRANATENLRKEGTKPRPNWDQSSWADGPGFLARTALAGYFFSSGVHVKPDGSLELSRLDSAADSINMSLKGDGVRDIVVANSGNYEFIDSPFAQIRKRNKDHDMPNAQIYWGGPGGYDARRTTGIPGDRPSSVAAIDLNLDGILDLVVAGGGEFHPPYVKSRIYWGTKHGYSEENCTLLPTSAATGIAVGDLNKDGYPDIVFANLGNYNFPFPPSVIYWGGPNGFSADNRTELESHGVGGLAIADVNNDGWLDIVLANSAGFPPIEQLMDYGQNYAWPNSYIYLGGPDGFSKNRRISLPTKGATGVKVADLNKDGYPDIVFANAGSFGLPPLPDTYIYWGGPHGYSPAHRTDLSTNGASAVSIADLNGDGWPDLVLSVTGTYLYIGEPKFPDSYVYWGGPNGFSDQRRLALPTEASQGNVITDVNGDGILDIVFSQIGDFNPPYRPVLIYYGTGDSKAFYTQAKTGTLPAQISYGSIVVGPPDGGDHMSHGNLAIPKYDHPTDFVREGQLISSVYDGIDVKWEELSYDASVPSGTKVRLIFESRTGGHNWSESGEIDLLDGSHTVVLAGAGIKPGFPVRYRLVLQSSRPKASPIVRRVQFR